MAANGRVPRRTVAGLVLLAAFAGGLATALIVALGGSSRPCGVHHSCGPSTTAPTTTAPITGTWGTVTAEPPPPTTRWTAGMEAGNLNEWNGEYNSGGGDSIASQSFAHTGSWSAKQTISPSGSSQGTRLFRWSEFRQLAIGQAATVSVWVYLPATVSVGGYFNLYQFKSKTQNDQYIDVFFQANLVNRSGGGLALRVAWGCGAENPAFPAGPYPNSQGLCDFFTPLADVPVPVGQWFQIKGLIIPSSGYSGRFLFWQNNVLLYDFGGVKTGYPNTNSVNGVDTQWAVNAYGNGLTPSLYSHYVDDALIAS